MPPIRLPLTMTKAGDLPPVCIVCGGAVDVHVPRSFTWRPPWMRVGMMLSFVLAMPVLSVLFIFGAWSDWRGILGRSMCCAPLLALPALSTFLMGLLRTRRVEIECPLCERHRRYWTVRNFLLFAPLLVLLIVVLTLAALLMVELIPGQVFSYLIVGTSGLLLIWAIGSSLLQRFSLRATSISEDDVTLSPVAEEFAALLQGRRQKRRDAPDFGWEDYDPYPRRRR